MEKLTDKQIEQLQKYSRETEALYSEYATKDGDAVRMHGDTPLDPLRSQFGRDADRIINCKFFNRGADKTQVFSFRKNDDITRRSSHVQLVSRIARRIGKALRLNLELIEAIAIGHDIGHTPFGHAGEEILSDLYFAHAGKYFNHNVHSVRVLNLISHNNLTLQTLDSIICHCGEKVDEKYTPAPLPKPVEFYKIFEDCYTQENAVKKLRPATLEGCVVRLSDMIAYIGKDRQDAMFSLDMNLNFSATTLGMRNAEIIENITNDVIANSMDKPYLSLSSDVFDAIESYKAENNEKIYKLPAVRAPYNNVIRPMTEKMYEKLRNDIINENTNSIIYKHYLYDGYVISNYFGDNTKKGYVISTEPDDLVTDFIASMTDDYFLDAFAQLFPDDELNNKVKIIGYFDKL